MIAEFINPEDSRWKYFLRHARHDFYHLPEYVAFASEYDGGTPLAFYAEDKDVRFLAPLLIRKVPAELGAPEDWCDATTPYGYPTPLMSPPDDPSQLGHFLKAFQEAGKERRIVAAFFRFHPLFPLPKEPLLEYGTVVHHGQTVYVDLLLPFQEIWAQTRNDHRMNIKKLSQSGFQAKMDDWTMFEEFIKIYTNTMRRVSADAYYTFPHRYFTGLRSLLGDRMHLCTVVSFRGELAAAGLFPATEGIVQFHLSGSDAKYLSQAPSKLMLHFVTQWMKEKGSTSFHLGGGLGGRLDPLFEFKAGFSKLRSDFYTYRMILDQDKYATLVRLCGEKCGSVDQSSSQFFPAYRDPSIKQRLEGARSCPEYQK